MTGSTDVRMNCAKPDVSMLVAQGTWLCSSPRSGHHGNGRVCLLRMEAAGMVLSGFLSPPPVSGPLISYEMHEGVCPKMELMSVGESSCAVMSRGCWSLTPIPASVGFSQGARGPLGKLARFLQAPSPDPGFLGSTEPQLVSDSAHLVS